ncbi:MAG: hypothetical protein NTX61_09860 [Bacteroidetes bacterium]|nr:hypothetical protein [Bacteroidota bacterium]
MTKIKNNPHRKIGKINSLQDLKLEKARLELDIVRTEEKIRSNYRNILDIFTFRNLFHLVTQDIYLTSNVITKLISVGKNLLRKKGKKKTKDQEKEILPPVNDEITGE